MNTTDIISNLISLLAVCIAATALSRSRKTARRQLEQGEVIAELSAKQLERHLREDAALSQAEIDVRLVPNRDIWKFVISNHGGAPAKNVSFDISEDANPVIQQDLDKKIPISNLRPWEVVELRAVMSQDGRGKYKALVSWENPDGSIRTKDFELWS